MSTFNDSDPEISSPQYTAMIRMPQAVDVMTVNQMAKPQRTLI
jgi:hypothetical protein